MDSTANVAYTIAAEAKAAADFAHERITKLEKLVAKLEAIIKSWQGE